MDMELFKEIAGKCKGSLIDGCLNEIQILRERLHVTQAELAEANATIEEQIKVRHAWELDNMALTGKLEASRAEITGWKQDQKDNHKIQIDQHQQILALKAENQKLRETLQRIQTRCAGEAMPNWENTPHTGHSRGWILDRTNAALSTPSDTAALDAHTANAVAKRLEELGSYVTNDASREACIRDEIAKAIEELASIAHCRAKAGTENGIPLDAVGRDRYMWLESWLHEQAIIVRAHKEEPEWDGEIRPADFKVETFSERQGGFFRHPDNGVRITHIPTGMVAECSEERSQHRNRHTAFDKLTTALTSTRSRSLPGGHNGS